MGNVSLCHFFPIPCHPSSSLLSLFLPSLSLSSLILSLFYFLLSFRFIPLLFLVRSTTPCRSFIPIPRHTVILSFDPPPNFSLDLLFSISFFFSGHPSALLIPLDLPIRAENLSGWHVAFFSPFLSSSSVVSRN